MEPLTQHWLSMLSSYRSMDQHDPLLLLYVVLLPRLEEVLHESFFRLLGHPISLLIDLLDLTYPYPYLFFSISKFYSKNINCAKIGKIGYKIRIAYENH